MDLVRQSTGEIQAHTGGGPFNTARTLGRLGAPVAYMGRLSSDSFGELLTTALKADHVQLDSAPSTDDPTTLALAQLDESGSASYRFYTAGTSVPGLTPEAALSHLPSDVTAVHIGTLGLVLEPFATAAQAVLDSVIAAAVVVIDPNIRPLMIPDRDRYLERLAHFVRRATVVKVSDEDLAWMSPGASIPDAAATILGDGAGLVLVTKGASGVDIFGRSFTRHVAAPIIDVVDTIGAGDSFAGGILAWWHANDHADLTSESNAVMAAEFAVRVAAITCTRAGANPPTSDELTLALD